MTMGLMGLFMKETESENKEMERFTNLRHHCIGPSLLGIGRQGVLEKNLCGLNFTIIISCIYIS